MFHGEGEALSMAALMSDQEVIDRVFRHIDAKTTDLGDEVWREPTDNYRSAERFERELELLRRLPIVYCPSAALPDNGSYIARTASGVPLVVVRGDDGVVRAFHNCCRHRGMAVAEGSGILRSFVCRYHAWTYGLDGGLKHIPAAHGFPDLDMAAHGLKQVHAEERGGLVFVTQKDPVSKGTLADLPDLIEPNQRVFLENTLSDDANWKLLMETSMEGYHIKALHNSTFYPYGFDNLNVVETYGPNSRLVFPFRRIEKLRDMPSEQRRADGMLTYVYQLFPNVRLATLSSHYLLIILEPVTPSQSRWHIYRLTPPSDDGSIDIEESRRDAEFVRDTGVIEDREAARAIQDGLKTEANSHFTFGRCEAAAVHFHKHLHAHLEKLA